MLSEITFLFLLYSDLLRCAVSDDPLPNIRYDLLNSKICTCPKSSDDVVQQLEDDLNAIVLHRGVSNVTFAISNQQLLTIHLNDYNCHCSGISNFSDFSEINHRGHRNRVTRSTDLEWFNSYHNFSSIFHWFEELSLSHPDRVELIPRIGRTYNNRDIFAVKLTQKNVVKEKNKVYLQCLLHAREWITGPMCMYIAYRLATEDKTDSVTADILAEVEFIMVPVANPDGYQLTWTDYPKYRLWRKNLSKPNKADLNDCLGVDLNRNFNIEWGTQGSSSNQCSETYCGPSAESEHETKSIRQFLEEQKPLIGALDFHSFSQAVLYPSGWSKSLVEDSEHLKVIANSMAKTASRLGTQYTSEQMGSIYLASGTFGDWIYSKDFLKGNIDSKGSKYRPMPITVELRPRYTAKNGVLGFMVPPDQIISTCSEMYDSVLKYVTLLLEHKDTWLQH